MTRDELKTLARATGTAVKDFVGKALAPIVTRLDAQSEIVTRLESRIATLEAAEAARQELAR